MAKCCKILLRGAFGASSRHPVGKRKDGTDRLDPVAGRVGTAGSALESPPLKRMPVGALFFSTVKARALIRANEIVRGKATVSLEAKKCVCN